MSWKVLVGSDTPLRPLCDKNVTVLKCGECLKRVSHGGRSLGRSSPHATPRDKGVEDRGQPLHEFLRKHAIHQLRNRKIAIWCQVTKLSAGQRVTLCHEGVGAVHIEVTEYRTGAQPLLLARAVEEVDGSNDEQSAEPRD